MRVFPRNNLLFGYRLLHLFLFFLFLLLFPFLFSFPFSLPCLVPFFFPLFFLHSLSAFPPTLPFLFSFHFTLVLFSCVCTGTFWADNYRLWEGDHLKKANLGKCWLIWENLENDWTEIPSQLPELWENMFLLFNDLMCGILLQQPEQIHTNLENNIASEGRQTQKITYWITSFIYIKSLKNTKNCFKWEKFKYWIWFKKLIFNKMSSPK